MNCVIEGCPSPVLARKRCQRHYYYWSRYERNGLERPTPESRFWSKVEKTDTCWLWTAADDGHGYGAVNIYGSVRKAYRVAWEWENGPVPEGKKLDHKCRVKACVNPAHLHVVTNKQNMENVGVFKNNTSGYRGVVWDKSRGKWQARTRHNGRTYLAGRFDDPEEANRAVIEMRNRLHTNNLLDRDTPSDQGVDFPAVTP